MQKKIVLIVCFFLISTAAYAEPPAIEADQNIKKYCSDSISQNAAQKNICLQAHNIKLQLQILDELKKLREDIKDLKDLNKEPEINIH